MSERILLDASAYIAWINKELGSESVEKIINKAVINTVTYTEIISFYARIGLETPLLEDLCKYVSIININEEISFNAGKMIKISKEFGLSLGDRLCLSSAIYFKLKVYTADKIWLNLSEKLNLQIILIR